MGWGEVHPNSANPHPRDPPPTPPLMRHIQLSSTSGLEMTRWRDIRDWLAEVEVEQVLCITRSLLSTHTPGQHCSNRRAMLQMHRHNTTHPFNDELSEHSCTEMRNKHTYTQWATESSQLIFVCNFIKRSTYFNAVFTVRFKNKWHM